MLLWAIFTLGFMLGVFLTLFVFVKDTEKDYSSFQPTSHIDNVSGDYWVVHQNLVKINYATGKSPKYEVSTTPQLT
jgi:hypothetical protein